MSEPQKFQIQYLEPGTLIPYFRNTKEHTTSQIDLLKKSISEYSFDQPIVVDAEMVIIKGHGRHQAAIALEMTEVPVIVRTDLSEAAVRASRIADNKIAASTDLLSDMLTIEMEELKLEEDYEFDSELLGFETGELELFEDEMLAQAAIEENQGVEDNGPGELPETPKTVLGDVIQLGNHRLVCGSSTDPLVVDSVLGDDKVDQLLTDPPYGIGYVEGKNDGLFKNDSAKQTKVKFRVENDTADAVGDYRVFFAEFLSIIPFAQYNTIYCFLMGSEIHNLRLAFDDCGITWSDYLVWAKNNHVLSRKDYNAKHEWIAYGWMGKHKFYGPHRTTMLEYPKPHKSELHPTMKPLVLLEQLVADGSPAMGVVMDGFGGSGSTLIACEKLGRKCRMIELSPHYCDVIVKRWEDFTGKTAKYLNADPEEPQWEGH